MSEQDPPRPEPERPGEAHAIIALRMYQAREAFQLMGFGALVGLLSGLAGVILSLSVRALEFWRHSYGHHSLALVLFPCFGALLGIAIQRYAFRDLSGHGVPDVIQAVSTGQGLLPTRMIFSRIISSFLTVGSGGATGLEGPIVVCGGSIGSMIGKAFHFSQRRRILMIACGTSGAVAGIFNAPLTGLIFSLEVILGEWKSRNLVPTVTSAAVAAQVSRLLMGDKIPFPRESLEYGIPDLPAFVLLGVFCAYTGLLLVRWLHYTGTQFHRLPLPAPVRAGIGGLLVGSIAFFFPAAMGEGYDSIRLYIGNGDQPFFLFVAGLFFLRLATTGFTLGSGGAGGVFAPSLFFGSALGYVFGHLLRLFSPLINFAQPSAFALVGMAGLVAGIMNAPLTGLFLIMEISHSYDLILPLMLTTLVSMLVWRFKEEGSIYTRDLISAGTFKRRGSEQQLLADVALTEVMQPCQVLPAHYTLGDFVEKHGRDSSLYFALEDEEGFYRGLVFLEELRPYLFEREMYPLLALAGVADCEIPAIGDNATPDQAWLAFTNTKREVIPVLNGNGRLAGVVTKSKLFDIGRRESHVHQHDV